MISVGSTHIQLTLCCENCGHEWDIEDYDSNSIDDSIMKAEAQEVCPDCRELQEED